MKPFNLLLTVLFLALGNLSIAQDSPSGPFKKSLFDADALFDDNSQLRALVMYDSLWNLRPNDTYLQYRTGVCYTFSATGREQAFDILKDLKGQEGYEDVTFWMARAQHLDYNFEKAIDLYNEYLEMGKPNGTMRINTLHYIRNCENGIELMKRRMALTLEILSPPSNQENSQYSPVISADGSKLYYTNRGPESAGEMMDNKSKSHDLGKYYEDIFVAENIGEEFEFDTGYSIGSNVNLPGRHEAPLSISYDNDKLFVYISSNNKEEDIYISYNQGDTAWTDPEKMDAINSPHWEGHAVMSPDNRIVYFASDRPGGYGGRDIYQAVMGPDSTYSEITNLGPKINTPFNEDAPFIYSNGSSLYFASEAHGSMGGYDIFYIKFDSTEMQWQEAVNLGYPINTTDDDRFYYITADGDWGYFSSARASGENLHDIYRIQPGTFERLNALVLLVGTVYIDEVRSSALAKIMDDQTGDVLATLIADSTTGEFYYSLIPGRKYKISLLADGFPPKTEHIEVPAIREGVLRIEHRFDFYTDGFIATRDSSNIQSRMDSLANLAGDPDGVCDVDPDREELTDEEIASGCYFRVQVGAYRNPGRFKYDFLRSLDEVEIKGYSDGITRYLMGEKFTKRSEAEVLRQKCIVAGEWDAWITVRR